MRKKIVALIVAGLMISAAQPSQAAQPKQAPPGQTQPEEVLSTDIVVVGSGGAGMSAAIQARQSGKEVIVLEKLAFTGGNSAFTEGVFGINSHWQREAGVEIAMEDILKEVMEYHQWKADAVLTKAFFERSAETIDWMESVGVVFRGVRNLGPSQQVWHTFEGSGAGAMKSLYEAAISVGATFMLETPGQELTMENGRVTGVIAQKPDGSRLRINADAVILATGGFANSEEMITTYAQRNYSSMKAMGIPGRTGDGIRMGLDVGADVTGMSTLMLCGGGLYGVESFDSHLNATVACSPFFWVNERAERFADESIVSNFAFSGNVMDLQKSAYMIMDDATITKMETEGHPFGLGDFIHPGTKLINLRRELDEEMAKGHPDIFKADSIVELAQKMGVNPQALQATVDRYNSMAAAGHDSDFGKDAKYLYPVSTGPYYGFKLITNYFTTVGGLRINKDAEVLNASREVIPGLYAAGSDAGGLYGASYDVGIAAGSQIGSAISFGRVAGQSAAKYIEGK